MTNQTQQHTTHEPNSAALDVNKISTALDAQPEFADRIDWFPEIGSTNTYLTEYKDPENIHGRVCITDFQSAGRGRWGREWISSAQKNLTLSIAWNFAGGLQQLNGLSLAVGVMLANCFFEKNIAQLGLKWPNDLYLDDRKVGGILIETISLSAGVTCAVIGVGLNIDMKIEKSRAESLPIDQPWTCLSLSDSGLDRNQIAALTINALRSGLKVFAEYGLQAFANDWRKRHTFAGKRVTIEQDGQRLTGVLNDIDADGALLLHTDTGEAKRITSGEINQNAADDRTVGACLRPA